MMHPPRIMAALTLLAALALSGCGDSAKPVPVKHAKKAPPYAANGIDAVGVGRDPSHHSPFGATDGAETGPVNSAKKP